MEMPHGNEDARLEYATNIIRRICALAGDHDLIENVRRSFRQQGLLGAIRYHEDDAIFAWLAETINFQGVSDAVAATYLDEHTRIKAWDIRIGLIKRPLCAKLRSYWDFEN